MKKPNPKRDAYDNPVWLKWRCEAGSQWTTVKGGTCSDEERNGQQCLFSGCAASTHSAHIVGETADRTEAHNWFHRYDEPTPEPEDHTDDICPCGDPDCSRPFGHE